MTTSSGWDPTPTAPPTITPEFETTPIADELSAGTVSDPTAGTFDDASGDTSAKDRAQEAAGTAKEQGAEVASTAADEVKHVAGEAKAKATDLLSEVKAQVDEQSKTQLQGLASKLGELGDELDALVRGDGSSEGTVTDVARQLSERTRSLSNHLADREPSELVADVRSFARRRPGAFLVGAAAAGLIAGRLTRGAQKANSQNDTTGATAPASSVAPTPPSTFSSDPAADAFGGPLATDVPLGQNTGGRQ